MSRLFNKHVHAISWGWRYVARSFPCWSRDHRCSGDSVATAMGQSLSRVAAGAVCGRVFWVCLIAISLNRLICMWTRPPILFPLFLLRKIRTEEKFPSLSRVRSWPRHNGHGPPLSTMVHHIQMFTIWWVIPKLSGRHVACMQSGLWLSF